MRSYLIRFNVKFINSTFIEVIFIYTIYFLRFELFATLGILQYSFIILVCD